MNTEAAIAKVEEYLELWHRADDAHERRRDKFSYLDDPVYKDTIREMQARIGLVEQIAAEVDDRLAARIRSASGYSWTYAAQKSSLEELLGRLKGREEEARILGPSGPQLAARQMHPWVWNAASSLWDDGHYVAAVTAAATAVFETYLPAKLEVPKVGTATTRITSAFSTSAPRPSDPRLRFKGLIEGTPDWTSAHEGAMFFGKGCAQGVRNVTTHGAQPSEQEALEALAALSLLARWIDEAMVETTP